ncbi:MAG: contractile injection system tape measure protein [Aeromonas popoffii]
MININVIKLLLNISSPCKIIGEEVLSSTLLSAGKIKDTLRLAAKNVVISGEISMDKWVINLGVIPAAQFDTLFIPRLAQAFAERLACEQASITGQQAMKMATSNATESSVLLDGKHLDGEGLIKLARSCLTPQAFKALLQDSPAYQLQQLLKRLLEGAWQSPKMLPASWYYRVTASRLSIAAVLYLLKHQRGHNWLNQHIPSASQVTDWTKAIGQGEIPPEQVAQLLTGNRSSDGILIGQPAYPSLIVMRWLLPLWRQPAVRKEIHRLTGGRGVQHFDAYLSRCLQRQDDDAMQKEKGMHTVPEQVAPPQDNTVSSQGWGVESDAKQVARSSDNSTMLEGKGMQSDPQQVALPWDNATLLESDEMPATSRRTMPPRKGGLRSPNEPRLSSQGISNAGLLLLWPLLPQLFSHLGLCEKEQFISDAARWQAVYGLDRLVWGEANPTTERLTLNQVLCGVSLLTPVPQTTPLSVLQQRQIDDWLTAIGQQLIGWQKLSLTDIRQLFLQRVGEVSTEGVSPEISVRQEPYDYLLKDWPWPMTLASFPWTEQPLTIVWSLNGFTG